MNGQLLWVVDMGRSLCRLFWLLQIARYEPVAISWLWVGY